MSRRPWRRRWLWLLVLIGVLVGLVASVRSMVSMPGRSHAGPLPPLTPAEQSLAQALHRDVQVLAGDIGERNHVRYQELKAALQFVEERFRQAGYEPTRETFEAEGKAFANVVAERHGTRAREPMVIVGAHYDSVLGSPGANDNGSGVAALLALAEHFQKRNVRRTLRFVAFANEEPPHFRSAAMGSLVHARRCREAGVSVEAMLSLETMGFFSDAPGSQSYPPPLGWLYPSRGNFMGFVANFGNRGLLHRVIGSFRSHTRFPSEGAALPAVTPGVGWSDHWAFWQFDYPALMVTDTAPFRYPHYHTAGDTPDRVDFGKLARVVAGVARVVEELAGPAD